MAKLVRLLTAVVAAGWCLPPPTPALCSSVSPLTTRPTCWSPAVGASAVGRRRTAVVVAFGPPSSPTNATGAPPPPPAPLPGAAGPDTLAFLAETLGGVGRAQAAVALSPQLAGRSPEQLRATRAFLAMLYGPEKAGEAVRANPRLLAVDVASDPAPAEEYLRGVGMTKATLKTVERSKPHFLYMSVDASLRPRADFLRSFIGEKGLARVLNRYPGVLGLSVERNIRPTVEYLVTVSDAAGVAKAVTNHPQILGYSIERSLEPMCAYLRSIGVKRVRRVLELAPSLWGMSLTDNIMPKVAFFDECGMDAGKMIELHPTSFTLSLEENIKPTVAFLVHEVRMPNAHVEIQRNPSLLDNNLERNIKPTAEYMASLGYDLQRDLRARHLSSSLPGRLIPRRLFLDRVAPNTTPTLATLAAASDPVFCHSCGVDLCAYRAFKEEVEPGLKFQADLERWVATGRSISAG